MASPDKTPLEERMDAAIVGHHDLWARIEELEAVVVRLREALRGLMGCVHTDTDGNLGADFADWAEPWSKALAALVVSPDKPPKPVCDNCRGKGWLDENGNPTVPGRADSYECQECGGTGVSPDKPPEPR